MAQANPISSAKLPAPVPPRVVTHVPPPSIPSSYLSAPRAASTARTPRYSSSPIPPPTIPHHVRSSTGLTAGNGTPRSSHAGGSQTPRRPEVIIIDDDNASVSEPVARGPEIARTPQAALLGKSPGGPPQDLPAQSGRSSTPSATSRDIDFRKAAHSLVWRGRSGEGSMSKWFSRSRQPYLAAAERALVLAGAQKPLRLDVSPDAPVALHVDLSAEEISYLHTLTVKTLRLSAEGRKRDALKNLGKILRRNQAYIPRILDAAAREKRLARRTRADIERFFRDVLSRKTRSDPVVLSLRKDDSDRRGDLVRSSRIHSLLMAREVAGQRGFGSMRQLDHFNNEFRKCREDALELRAEWAGGAGDIATIAWVSNYGFICGTTNHSDSHNQQYNKPGNLILGSCSLGTLQAYPHHRIVRPIVEKGENSTEEMIQSQEPWLYTSVVSSDYDAVHDRAFTSGFDKSVKIWRVRQSGESMSLLGEWKHGGNVNFVATSKHESGMVATAADVAADAVRIYRIDEANISESPFRSYSCSRVTDADGNTVSTEKWSYYPATMQWGLCEEVRHLLLVGYSPRSRTGDDNDISEDRLQSGELCLWDGLTGERWRITSATTQNVFEVLWHPSQPSFIAATSPLGLEVDPGVRTQIRIFRPSDNEEYGGKAFSPLKTLDCMAVDINELTIMYVDSLVGRLYSLLTASRPNSDTYCYVTAGCTDGNVYVWDTALGDKPLHILRHGQPIDPYSGNREQEDVGVKFTAWGTTPDRFYTGSSDGFVKVWNVRSHAKTLVRHLLKAPAAITAGMFSPDRSRLVVGDASGRVWVLSLEEDEQMPGPPAPGSKRPPRQIKLHPEPEPPSHDAAGRPIESETGVDRGRAYLDRLQLERHPNPTIGAVQGPRYAETGLFCREAHFREDLSQPLLARWEVLQQEAHKGFSGRRRDQFTALRSTKEAVGLEMLHMENIHSDLDYKALPDETRLAFKWEGVDFGLMMDYVLDYEEIPYVEEFEEYLLSSDY